MNIQRTFNTLACLGVVLMLSACGGSPTLNLVPFAPEKTRVMIAASPEEVASVIEADFVNRFREEHAKKYGSTGPARLASSTRIIPPDLIRVKFGASETQRADTFDFYFQKVPGGVSIVGDGYAMVTGTVENPGPVMKMQYRNGDNEEALVKGLLLEVKAKAEALHAKNEGKK